MSLGSKVTMNYTVPYVSPGNEYTEPDISTWPTLTTNYLVALTAIGDVMTVFPSPPSRAFLDVVYTHDSVPVIRIAAFWNAALLKDMEESMATLWDAAGDTIVMATLSDFASGTAEITRNNVYIESWSDDAALGGP